MNLSIEKEEPVAFKSIEKRYGKINHSNNQSTNSGRMRSKTQNTQDKQKLRCFKCNKPGHFARFCRNTSDTVNTVKCGICKRSNHAEKDCYFRKNKQKQIKDEDKEIKDKVSFLISEEETLDEFEWILDSGSSSHMMNDESLFKEIFWQETEIGIAKKKEKMKARGVGIVETEKCILNNVLFVPELSKNLLSISAIVQNGGQVVFVNNKTEIRKDGKIFTIYRTKQDLWLVNLGSRKEEKHALMTEKYETAYEWHKRMGHLGAKNMKKLLKLSEGIKIAAEKLKKQLKIVKFVQKQNKLEHHLVKKGQERRDL